MLRKIGELVDAPGRWLVGTKGEYPLRTPYLYLRLAIFVVDEAAPPQVTGQILDAAGVLVVEAAVTCEEQ